MPAGKLTINEKYIIQGMNRDGASVESIATSLGRTVKTVTNYLEDLDRVQTTVANVQTEEVMKEEVPQAKEKPTSPEVIDKAIKMLIKAGYVELDANKMVNQALRTFFNNVGTDNPQKLMDFSLRFIKTGELMQKTTMGGNEGVTIMTGAASDRSDYSKKRGKINRKCDNATFSLKNGEKK